MESELTKIYNKLNVNKEISIMINGASKKKLLRLINLNPLVA